MPPRIATLLLKKQDPPEQLRKNVSRYTIVPCHSHVWLQRGGSMILGLALT